MADFKPYQNQEFAFAQLLAELSQTWPANDIAYVQDLVKHAEYGEALENLVALGARNGRGFGAGQRQQMEAMAAAMGMKVSVPPTGRAASAA